MHVPDPHLYDKEIGVTRGYAEQSLEILDIIKDEYISGEYDLVTLGGDIQHAKIVNTRYISEFQKRLRDIGVIVKQRLLERDLLKNIKVYNMKMEGDTKIYTEIEDLESRKSILFTVRGQHDTNNIEEFTFFDLLVENDILINPRVLMIDEGLEGKTVQLNFLNYSKKMIDIQEDIRENVSTMINIYHNPILEKGVFIDSIIGTTISPTSHNLFENVDLAIINDIHLHIPTYDVACSTNRTVVVTPGSLGRTSFNKSHDRDYGHLLKVDIDRENKEHSVAVTLVEVDLVPSDEFFNKAEAYKIKRTENAFKNFCLEIEDAKINYFDINDEIHKYVSDEEIRDICLNIVKEE